MGKGADVQEITLRKIRNILPEIVRSQIPRTVCDRGLGVTIECDSAMLRVYAVITVPDQRWRFELQEGVFEGRRALVRLRDEDVALLCVSA